MKNIYKIFSLLLLTFVIVACNEDDNTGHSTLNIGTTPTLSIDYPSDTAISVIEDDSEYPFTITLSEVQQYDTHITLDQIAGDATLDLDYEMSSTMIIPALSTSASGLITILSDELAEGTETLKISIGGLANNANIVPLVVDFTILNLEEDDLIIDLSYTAIETVTDNVGTVLTGVDLADLKLLVTDVNIPYTIPYLTVDNAAGAETLVFSAAFPDGEYYLVSDFWSAETPGDVTTGLDLTLTFNQTGIINDQVITISNALNTGNSDCQAAILAKLTKSGTTYSVEPVGLPNSLGTALPGTFVGDYLIEEITPLVDGYTLDSGTVVAVYETGVGERGFMTANYVSYCSTPMEFLFELNDICGQILIPGEGNQSNCSCGGNLFFTSATTPTSFDPADDTYFELTFTNDAFSDCGPPNQTTYTFTKQ